MRERRRGLPLLAEQSALVLIIGSAVVSGTAEKTRTAYLVGIVLLSVALALHVFLFVYTLRHSAPPLLRNLHAAVLILLVAALATTVADLPIALTIPLKCAAAVAATGVLLVASAPPLPQHFEGARGQFGWQLISMGPRPIPFARGYNGQMPWLFPRQNKAGVMMPPGPNYFQTMRNRAEWKFRNPPQDAPNRTAIAYVENKQDANEEMEKTRNMKWEKRFWHLQDQQYMTKTLVLLGLMTAEEGDNALRWFDEHHGKEPYITKNTVLGWFNHKAYLNDPDYVWHRTALTDVDKYKAWVFDLKNNLQVGDRALAVYELEEITDGNVHVERFKIISREQNGLRIYDFNVDSAQIIPDSVADVSLRAAFEQLQKNGIVAIYTLGK